MAPPTAQVDRAVLAATGSQKWVFNPASGGNSTPANFGMNNNYAA